MNYKITEPKSLDCFSKNPNFTILIPALNEELTIKKFIEWCKIGVKKSKIKAEVIIIDSSNDNTAKIALKNNARVLKIPRNGLGNAYKNGIKFIKGKYVIMGDCDLTYDFRDLSYFVESFKNGNEYVMGSRYKGSIEGGAMPFLHQYFGTPVTTMILNLIYKSNFSDIHCGMRGITLKSLKQIKLKSDSWEYASEMVLKSIRYKLKIDEVPVKFYKDIDGRLSHHKREGFWSPWYAGWINLKIMILYSADTFMIAPGIFLFSFGFILMMLSYYELNILSINLNTHMMLLGLILMILGFIFFQFGVITRLIHNLRLGFENKILKALNYNKGILISLILFLSGIIIEINFLLDYINNNYTTPKVSNSSIFGLGLIITSMQLLVFTLTLSTIKEFKK